MIIPVGFLAPPASALPSTITFVFTGGDVHGWTLADGTTPASNPGTYLLVPSAEVKVNLTGLVSIAPGDTVRMKASYTAGSGLDFKADSAGWTGAISIASGAWSPNHTLPGGWAGFVGVSRGGWRAMQRFTIEKI